MSVSRPSNFELTSPPFPNVGSSCPSVVNLHALKSNQYWYRYPETNHRPSVCTTTLRPDELPPGVGNTALPRAPNCGSRTPSGVSFAAHRSYTSPVGEHSPTRRTEPPCPIAMELRKSKPAPYKAADAAPVAPNDVSSVPFGKNLTTQKPVLLPMLVVAQLPPMRIRPTASTSIALPSFAPCPTCAIARPFTPKPRSNSPVVPNLATHIS